MRIAIIGSKSSDSKAQQISAGLSDLGFSNEIVFSVKPTRRLNAYLLGEIEKHLPNLAIRRQLRLIRKLNSDFSCLINTEQELQPKVVSEVKKLGIKVLFWFPDGIGNVSDRQHIFSAPYDFIFVTDPIFAESLRTIYGKSAYYLPESAHPKWHFSSSIYGVEKVCVIIGTYYPSRLTLIQRLIQDGVPLRLYGPKPKKWVPLNLLSGIDFQPPKFKQQKAEIFRKASVVLNLAHPYDVNSTNQRLFEATSAGGAVITNNVTNLSQLFAVGSEVLTFSNYDELLAKINYLFENPEFARQMADRAHLRTFREHLITHRLQEMLEISGIRLK